MFRRMVVSLVVLLPSLLIAGEAWSPPKHLDLAVKLLKGLQPNQTSYRHKDTVVKWPGEGGAKQGESHTDCSGFFNSLILHTYPQYNAESLKKWLGKARPTADSYFEAIRGKKGFVRITEIGQTRPGDFIAIKFPPGSADTGHTMLISGKPRLRKASAPLVPDTEQWEVAVIDSSRSGHGKTDTRRNEDGTFRSGLGSGILRLYTKAGTVVGFSWSVQRASEFHDEKTKPLVIGRLNPKYQP